MAGTVIRCHWRAEEMINEELALKSAEFARRLQRIDPLLSEIGLTGNKNGFRNMLKAPLVSALSAQDWNEVFEAERRRYSFVSVSYWNRRTAKEQFLSYNVTANESHNGNRIVIADLPDPLNNAACNDGIMAAAIDVFSVNEVSVFTHWRSGPSGWASRHWRVWLRDGEPWPSGPRSLDAAQGPYIGTEPWQGGTLYTWPEYEPWNYRPDEVA